MNTLYASLRSLILRRFAPYIKRFASLAKKLL